MQLTLISVVEKNGIIVARARVTAEEARIWIEVEFRIPSGARRQDIWRSARDQIVRYLDIA